MMPSYRHENLPHRTMDKTSKNISARHIYAEERQMLYHLERFTHGL